MKYNFDEIIERRGTNSVKWDGVKNNIFPIESPAIDSITVNKVGKVRRAKLYYLRALTGKKARIQEKRVNQ